MLIASDEEESLDKDSVDVDSDDDLVEESVASGVEADVADDNESEFSSSDDGDGEELSNDREGDELCALVSFCSYNDKRGRRHILQKRISWMDTL